MSLVPNFFIAGAPKAGTSSLHTWIADHPDALGSSEKETYFFVDKGTHMYRPNANIANGLEAYSQYFVTRPGAENPKIVIESTPAYIYYQSALQAIPQLPTTPKCLFVLREPSAQIYSLFQYFKNNWSWIPSEVSFEQYLAEIRSGRASFRGNELAERAIEYGKYVDFLVKWREKLGDQRMMVCTFDELVKDQQAFTKRVAMWLGLDAAFYDTYDFPRENETYEPKQRWLQKINVAVRKHLPQGAAYNLVRSAYRKINTKKPSSTPTEDLQLINQLKSEFTSSNDTLAREFKLDIGAWQQPAP